MSSQASNEAVACRTIRVRPGRTRRTLAWMAGLVALCMSPVALSVGLAAPSFMAAFLGLAGFTAWTVLDRSQLSGGQVTLLPDGIRLPAIIGTRTLKRADIESAYETPGGLVLTTRSGAAVELSFVEHKSDVILRHLGMTLDQAALTAPLRGMLGGFTRGLLTFMVIAPIIQTAAVVAGPRATSSAALWATLATFVASLAVAVLVASRWRPRVVVGVDGIRVIGILRPKFIPHGRIVDVRVVDSAGYLSLFVHAGERTHLLPLIGQSRDAVDGLARRVQESRARHRGAAGVRDLSVLDRAGLSFPAWRESLRRASLASGGFRAAALETRDFEEVLQDPGAPIERRVGAALALREVGPEACAKIRIAASTSVEPRVRVALEAVAHEEIDEAGVEGALRMRA